MNIRSRAGFTLIEIIAVLLILAILAAVAIPKYVDLQSMAKTQALHAGVAELNGREALVWANNMIGTKGAVDDAAVWAAAQIITDLGTDYSWKAPPAIGGGTLIFSSMERVLIRTGMNGTSPGRWN